MTIAWILAFAGHPAPAEAPELAPPASPAEGALGSPPSSIMDLGAVVVGCDGVQLGGSGVIDSWDSRLGPYSPALSSDSALVASLHAGADVSIIGGAILKGSILAGRDILMGGSGRVTGDLLASRNIVFSGNPFCPTGRVQAGGSITTPGTWWDDRCAQPSWQRGAEIPVPQTGCDPLNVSQLVSGLIAAHHPGPGNIVPWPYGGWRPNPIHIDTNVAFDKFILGAGAHPLTIDATAVDYVYVDGDFELASSSQLHVQNPLGPDHPVEILFLVDGNFTTSGSSILMIDQGISLRVYVTGKVNIGGGAAEQFRPTIVVNGAIQPTFGIYTSYSGNDGVTVSNHAPLIGVVYAPLTHVEVSGSGEVYGAIRGRYVVIDGSGAIHYDRGIGTTSSWDGGGLFPADIALELVADRTEVGYNDEALLRILLANTYGHTYADVAVDVTIPPELRYVSHVAPVGTWFVDTDSDGFPDRWWIPSYEVQDTLALEILVKGVNIPHATLAEILASLAQWSGNDANPANNAGVASVHVLASPALAMVKVSSAPAAAPGAEIVYTMAVSNLAEAPAHAVVVTAAVDPHLAFGLDTFGPGQHFRLTEGPVPAGLTLGTPEYSNDGGETWGYVPVSGGGGAPPGFDASVTHWRIPMVGTMAPNSSFQIEYRVIVR